MINTSMIFPTEIWGEISNHYYEVYCAIRLVNKAIYKLVSSIDIKGRFDYTYVVRCDNEDEFYIDHLAEMMRRLTVVYIDRVDVSIYEYGKLVKTCRYEINGDVYNLASMGRYKTVNNRELNESVFFEDGQIILYDRELYEDGILVCREVYNAVNRRYSCDTRVNFETSVILPDARPIFILNNSFYLYC
jgi:hypothetical protein